MTIQVSTLTKLGITVLAKALKNTTTVPLSSIKIISTVLACTGDETAADFSSAVYTKTLPDSTVIGSDVLRIPVHLDQSVGDFTIGTIGVFSGSTLIAVAAFPGAGTKIASNLPTSLGNIRTLYVDLEMRNISAAIAGAGSGPIPVIQTLAPTSSPLNVDLTQGDLKITVTTDLVINATLVNQGDRTILLVNGDGVNHTVTFLTNFSTQGVVLLTGPTGRASVINLFGDGTTSYESSRSLIVATVSSLPIMRHEGMLALSNRSTTGTTWLDAVLNSISGSLDDADNVKIMESPFWPVGGAAWTLIQSKLVAAFPGFDTAQIAVVQSDALALRYSLYGTTQVSNDVATMPIMRHEGLQVLANHSTTGTTWLDAVMSLLSTSLDDPSHVKIMESPFWPVGGAAWSIIQAKLVEAFPGFDTGQIATLQSEAIALRPSL